MMEEHWKKSAFGEREAWIGETEKLRLVLLPDLGAKIVSLQAKQSGREWLAQTDSLGNGGYDTPFHEGDLRGWDEMFPTIDPCAYPHAPWKGTPVPDHGEVWSIPWQADVRDNTLMCRVHGIRFPYRLEKRMTFEGDSTLVIEYEAANLSPFPFSYIWAAHPLFQVEAGMRLVVPCQKDAEVEVVTSKHDRLGAKGTVRPWPAGTDGIDLHVVPERSDRYEKYYFCEPLREGWARLEHSETGESVTLAFSLDDVPYFAVWANYGGYYGGYHVALEPSTGYGDAIFTASQLDKVVTLPGQGSRVWQLRVSVT